MNFKIGETFKIKDEKLLVLDIIDGNLFVIALDIGITTIFSNNSNNYKGSTLEKATNEWFRELDVPAIPRKLDLTTMDGSKCYGTMEVKAAPLTFYEWHKYAEIIIPHVKNWFWLATAWADPKWGNWGSNFVCLVSSDSSAYGSCYYGRGLAPAFILDKKFFEDNYNNDPDLLASFSTDALLAEVSRRVKEKEI